MVLLLSRVPCASMAQCPRRIAQPGRSALAHACSGRQWATARFLIDEADVDVVRHCPR
jgi:hypothetical protein